DVEAVRFLQVDGLVGALRHALADHRVVLLAIGSRGPAVDERLVARDELAAADRAALEFLAGHRFCVEHGSSPSDRNYEYVCKSRDGLLGCQCPPLLSPPPPPVAGGGEERQRRQTRRPPPRGVLDRI